MITKLLKSFLFLLIFSSFAFPQNNGKELLKALQNKFNDLSDLTAQFEQSSNGEVNLAGKIFYKKGNKFRLEMRDITIISDGKTVWNYSKNRNKVIISDYDSSQPSILSIENLINNYPSKCSVSEETKGKTKLLTLIPKEKGLSFSKMILNVGDNDLIQKAEIEQSASGKIEITIKDYKLNKGIPGSEFTFTPPEGCKTVDLR